MPELPEVETTRRGLQPRLEGERIRTAVVRSRALRQPVPRNLPQLVAGTTVREVARRGKYLLIDCGRGTLIVHLGMSGRLWLVDAATRAERHDHFDLVMASGAVVRLRDPRRFGLVLWHRGDALSHPLLKDIGPEPLGAAFDGAWLYRETRSRSVAIKQALMDSSLVAGVGNIYASEALFLAGIHPNRAAGRVSRERYARLAAAIKAVLTASIGMGGTTLRDFVGGDGRPGYFRQTLRVYDRAGEPCQTCGAPLRGLRIGQRSSFYCAHCQR